MAKRRFGRVKTRYIRAKSAFRRGARRAGVGKSVKLFQLDAMLYGAARGPVSNWVQNVLPIPVIGTIGDEVVMGIIDYLVAKNTSGMIRDVAVKGLVVENARLGEGLVGMTGLGQTVSSTASNAMLY